MVRSGFREYEVKKVAFSCLQQAGERKFSSSYSRNPERTIKSTPVPNILMLRGIPRKISLAEDRTDINVGTEFNALT